MQNLKDIIHYWSSLDSYDLLKMVWILIMVVLTLFLLLIFTCFIKSKPSGRKTVIGIMFYVYVAKLRPSLSSS